MTRRNSINEVVDVCLINNESLLAQLRCEYLNGVVSSHIFVEANVTHSGLNRGTSIQTLWQTRTPDNVEIVRVEVPEEVIRLGDRWAIEEFSRQWAVRHAQIRFPEAALLVCDIDELPSREQVANALSELEKSPIVTLPMYVSYQYANWFARGKRAFWSKAKAIGPAFFDPGLRFRKAPKVPGSPGQHFRYLDYSGEMISSKHRDFAHEELDIGSSQDSRLKWSESFQLTTVPEFDRLGSGILSVEKREGLPQPSAFACSKYPVFFGADRALEPFSRRLIASYLAHKEYFIEDNIDLSAMMNELAEGKALWRAVLAKIPHILGLSLISRVLLRLPHLVTKRPGTKIIDVLRGVNRYGSWARDEKFEESS